MAGTVRVRNTVAQAMNAILSAGAEPAGQRVGVLQLSSEFNKALLDAGICRGSRENLTSEDSAIFGRFPEGSSCEPLVYSPDSAQEAYDAVWPVFEKIAFLYGDALRAEVANFAMLGAEGGLTAATFQALNAVPVVSGASAEQNGNLTLLFIVVAIVAKQRLTNPSIPLPSMIGEPTEDMNLEQVELFNELSKSLQTMLSGGASWIQDFLTCMALYRYFKVREDRLSNSERSAYALLAAQTREAVALYSNAFNTFLIDREGISAQALEADFRKVLAEAEMNVGQLEVESIAVGAVGGTAVAGLAATTKVLIGLLQSPLVIPVTPLIILGGVGGFAYRYGSKLTEVFGGLARDWRRLAEAHSSDNLDLKTRITASIMRSRSGRCVIEPELTCYLKLGVKAAGSLYVAYRLLRYSRDQLTSS